MSVDRSEADDAIAEDEPDRQTTEPAEGELAGEVRAEPADPAAVRCGIELDDPSEDAE